MAAVIRRILDNDYALNMASKGYTVLAGLVSSILLTRYLGLSLRGEYAYVLQVASIAVLILDLGFSQTYSYFYRQRAGNVFGDFLGIYARQFGIQLALAVVVALVFRNATCAYICMLVPSGVLLTRMQAAMGVENIRAKIILYAVSITVNTAVLGALFVFRQAVGRDLFMPVLITASMNLVSVVMFGPLIARSRLAWRRNRELAREAIRFSLLPMLSILLVTFNYSIDIVLLRYMGTRVDLSLYAVAAGIVGYVWFIPDAFKEVVASRIARSGEIASVNLSMKLSLAALVLASVVFALAGKWALVLFYGADFAGSYGVTLVLLVGVISMVFYKMIGVLFLAEGRRVFYFLTLAAAVGVNIGANLYAIPRWGMYGCALASVASYTVCGGAFLAYYLRCKRIGLVEAIVLRPSDVRGLILRLSEAPRTPSTVAPISTSEGTSS